MGFKYSPAAVSSESSPRNEGGRGRLLSSCLAASAGAVLLLNQKRVVILALTAVNVFGKQVVAAILRPYHIRVVFS